jgi:ABC-type transport system involved in multi-copper enzyme maturation permease subunit
MSTDPGAGATTRIAANGVHDGAHARTDDGPATHRGVAPAPATATTSDVRHDRIRWGAVWTGALTTVTLYVVLQLLFFALGWLDLAVDGAGSGTTAAVVSGVLALVAFFLGGMATGASALWKRANDGMVNGVVTWAATVIALLLLAVVGGGALAGSLATQSGAVQDAAAGVDPAQATQAARESAGWTALALGLSMVAAAVGGSIGAKLWPGRGERDANRR